MTGKDVADRVAREKREGEFFIKWWCSGDDAVDFNIIDRFVATVRPEEAIDGFTLLTMDGMWEALLKLDPDNLERGNENGEEVIRWVWQDRDGAERLTVYPFTPQGLITLFDEELFA